MTCHLQYHNNTNKREMNQNLDAHNYTTQQQRTLRKTGRKGLKSTEATQLEAISTIVNREGRWSNSFFFAEANL